MKLDKECIFCYSTTYILHLDKINIIYSILRKIVFEWELPFQYFELYKMYLENLLLWKIKTA